MLMSNNGRAARLHYLAGTFRVLSPGDHVVCAVTGSRIPLEDLRYWSVARQEAYASAEASLEGEKLFMDPHATRDVGRGGA
jgi:hypothetical protein